jgi:hypothetical protein
MTEAPQKENGSTPNNTQKNEDVIFFVGVHVGAGYHAEENSPLYLP